MIRAKIWQCVLTLFLGIITGLILVVFAFSLPIAPAKKNVYQSLVVFEEEGTYPELIEGHYNSRLDNFTDAIMLTNAINGEGDNLLDKALNVYRILYDEKNPCEGLIAYAHNEPGYSISSYSRYWHGYLIFLKPLLLLFTYQEIRLLNIAVQMLTIILLIVLLVRKNLCRYLLPLGISIWYLCPIATAESLQFSSVFYITVISMLIFLKWEKIIIEKDFLFFCIIGIATAFFDLLSYPLVTLGMPLTLYIACSKKATMVELIKKTFVMCVFWGVGYTGMWGGKWLVASLLTDHNAIAEAIDAVLIRTSREVSYAPAAISVTNTYWRNLNVFLTSKLFLLITFASSLFMILKCRRTVKLTTAAIVPFILIAILPFIWYAFAANHSYVHFWFTYRTLTVSVFALLCILVRICGSDF